MKRILSLLSLVIGISIATEAQIIRYVAPNSMGTADGLTAANASDFLDPSFWTAIQSSLQTQPVVVKFVAGDYIRAYTEQSLILNEMGHYRNNLLLEGDAGHTIFTAPTGYVTKTIMFSLVNCQNISVKNFHFTGNGSVDYVFRVTSTSGKTSKNILIENCRWEDMRGIVYGASGTASGTSYVTFKNCTFKRIGLNAGSHMIYNAYDAHHISVIDSHFEDCTGDYVRFRDNLDYAIVKGTTFIRNPGFNSYPFISMPLFNDVNPGDEIFATNYSFTDNTFTNATAAIQFFSQGYDPADRNHLLTAQEGAMLTSGTDQQKKDVLLNNYKINTDLVRINNNTYNNISKQVILVSNIGYGSVSKGWTGEANISGLFNNSDEPLPWEGDQYTFSKWVESETLKNIEWNYYFTGGTSTVSGTGGIIRTSTPSIMDFLPKTTSGEASIMTHTNTTVNSSSFTLNGNGSLTMVHTAGSGTAVSPAKFSVRSFEASSKVMSAHFNVTLSNTAQNKQAIWYIAVGDSTASPIKNRDSAPSITGSTSTADKLYTVLRIRKVAFGNSYAVQARHNDGKQANPTTNWGWQTITGATLTSGNVAKIALFFNNTESQQQYIFNGVTKTLAAASYHIYIDDVQKGATLTNLVRNTYPTNVTIKYTGDLSGFSIMSREGAMSFTTEDTGTTGPAAYDNSASLMVTNFQIVHLATPTTTPVTLTDFKGNATNTGIVLNWQTASEQNNSHFILSRSSNGKDFSYLTRVEGNGTSNNINNYSYTDKNPFAGTNYYQLEQIDKDGTKTVINKIVPVKYMVSAEVFSISKISSNQLRAFFNSENGENAELSITDISGKVIYKTNRVLKQGNNQIDLFVPVKPGVYVATLKGTAETKSIKFLL